MEQFWPRARVAAITAVCAQNCYLVEMILIMTGA